MMDQSSLPLLLLLLDFLFFLILKTTNFTTNRRISPRKFHFLIVVVDSFTTSVSLFLDGEKVVSVEGVEELVTGGSVLGEEVTYLYADILFTQHLSKTNNT